MSDSLSRWLALREPADAAARSASLARTVADVIGSNDPVHVLDLATGSGSNLRYLAERLPRCQRWLVTDLDAGLLSHLRGRTSTWAAARGYDVETDADGLTLRGEPLDCHVAVRRLDLSTLETSEIFSGRQLVTASALLDLVSEQWLRALAARCHAAGAGVLFALSYDGRSSCSPTEPEDDMIRDQMNRHQHRDKGLGGPAAGPDAERIAARVFEEKGYRVRREQTDWVLGSEDGELQRHLIDGWAEAATEMAPDLSAVIASWRTRRLAHVNAGRSRLIVGHHDMAAWLPRS
jgi:hypothetical protein